MAYDRAGTGPWAWLKSVGSQDHPLEMDWTVARDGHLMSIVYFPKHPRSIRGGDIFVYYAAQHGALIGLMRVVSDTVGEHAEEERWKWSMQVRPLVTLPLRDAPTIYDSPIDPLRVRRQSHISLTDEEFGAIRELIIGKVVGLTEVE